VTKTNKRQRQLYERNVLAQHRKRTAGQRDGPLGFDPPDCGKVLLSTHSYAVRGVNSVAFYDGTIYGNQINPLWVSLKEPWRDATSPSNKIKPQNSSCVNKEAPEGGNAPFRDPAPPPYKSTISVVVGERWPIEAREN